MHMIVDRYMEKQHVWGWLALGNFLIGGAGGGLYITAYAIELYSKASNLKLLYILSIALVIAGLLCVMAEAGRPRRAAGVIRNLRTSWMSREALFASGLILFAAIDIILPNMLFRTLAWVSALGYVLCQGFMLAACKKIPAWNTPATAPLFITLSIAAGAAITCIASPEAKLPILIATALSAAALLIGTSYVAWPGATEYFRQALKREWNTAYLTAGLLLTTLTAVPAMLFNDQLTAGLLLIAGTSIVKYTIIIRMSYKLPVLPPLET